MTRKKDTNRGDGRGGKASGAAPAALHRSKGGRLDVAVSRLEQHHVDAFEALGAGWVDVARGILADRAAGTGSGLVAVVDAEPVGLVGLRFGDQAWELRNLHVHPSWRNRGIGTRLVAAVEELARFTGRVRLGVATDNAGARRLYERLGYRATGELETCEYDWLDDAGTSHHAVETSEWFAKDLG